MRNWRYREKMIPPDISWACKDQRSQPEVRKTRSTDIFRMVLGQPNRNTDLSQGIFLGVAPISHFLLTSEGLAHRLEGKGNPAGKSCDFMQGGEHGEVTAAGAVRSFWARGKSSWQTFQVGWPYGSN